MAGHDVVFHLAANPEARRALDNPRLDLEQGTIVTWNALEAARRNKVGRFVFASSGTVYGHTPDACDELSLGHLPISLYGASKLAGEAMLASYVECFGMRGCIVRFGNVVGPRATHGAILDFCRKLLATPDALEVLGDGAQSKPYLHVSDCVAGILFILDHGRGAALDSQPRAPGLDERPPNRRVVRRTIAESRRHASSMEKRLRAGAATSPRHG